MMRAEYLFIFICNSKHFNKEFITLSTKVCSWTKTICQCSSGVWKFKLKRRNNKLKEVKNRISNTTRPSPLRLFPTFPFLLPEEYPPLEVTFVLNFTIKVLAQLLSLLTFWNQIFQSDTETSFCRYLNNKLISPSNAMKRVIWIDFWGYKRFQLPQQCWPPQPLLASPMKGAFAQRSNSPLSGLILTQ